jgi:hypothetical protein
MYTLAGGMKNKYCIELRLTLPVTYQIAMLHVTTHFQMSGLELKDPDT